jgi:hypothetical protein
MVFVGNEACIGLEQSDDNITDKGCRDIREKAAVSCVSLILHGELCAEPTRFPHF